jgi:transposase-like protein
MATQRTQDSAAGKARVARAALTGRKTVQELARPSGVHPTQMAQWTPRLHKEMPERCAAHRAKREQDQEVLHAQLSQPIGHLKVAWDWLKKKSWTSSLRRRGSGAHRSIRTAVWPGSAI